MRMRLGVRVVSLMRDLPTLKISPSCIWQQDGEKDQQHENRCRRAARKQAALEHEVVDDESGQLSGDARPSTGKRADEVEGGDGELQLDHDNGHCDRPKRGKNDTAVHAYRSGAVDLRSLDEVAVDGAEAGKEERHGETG